MAKNASKSLKIGLVLDTSLDPNDGVQQYVVSVGEWLRDQGHDVHYLVGQTEKRDLPNVKSLAKNIGVRFNRNRTTIPLPTSRKKLKRILEKEQFDVLHVQIPHSPFMAQRLILEASPGTAVVGTFHIAPYNMLVSTGNRALGIWLKRSLKRFDEIISVSSAAADFAKKTFKVDSQVLPNVIDYSRFHDAKPLVEHDDNTLSILFLGRLVPRKGALTLLKAITILKDEKDLPKFRVLICGKGPQARRLNSYIAKNGLKDLVTLTGYVSEGEKPRYYASAGISVFPSSGGESFGIVLLEAMASGKAVVLAGDNPGYRSVMEPQPELLFDPKKPALLAKKLAVYLRSEHERHDLQKWAETYSAEFDVNVVGPKIVAVYNQALLKRRQQ